MDRFKLSAIAVCALFLGNSGGVAYEPPRLPIPDRPVAAAEDASDRPLDLIVPQVRKLNVEANPIEVAEETPVGKFVTVKIKLPEPSEPGLSIEKTVEFMAPTGATWDKHDCAEGSESFSEYLLVGTPGKYTVTVTVRLYETITVFVRNPDFPDDITKGKLVDRRIRVDGGNEVYARSFAIAGPTPPDPPPTPPTPPKPDVVAGERDVYLVHDERADDVEWQILANGLRNGDPAKYITDHKHSVVILDVNARDANGARPWPLTKFASLIDATKWSLIIVDRKTQQVAGSAFLTPKTTAANVVDAIRKAGG